MVARRRIVGRWWAGATAVVAALTLAGCDPSPSSPVTTARVAVGYAFGSLNSATALGRTPGSILVRGLTHRGFTSLDASGRAVPDTSFGTVEKISDAPLTVRYTIGANARWSDGVAVSGADLLLEWAARAGQFDEVVPRLAADGTIADPTSLAGKVAFAATSPALVHAPATPRFDARSLTVVYEKPVADWRVALDVNLPAHVIGRIALGGGAATPTPTATSGRPSPTASDAPSASTGAGATPSASSVDWASRVADAIVHADRSALVAVSRTWRTAGDAASLAADPTSAVTDGPYALSTLTAGRQVVLEPNAAYTGPTSARFSTLVVRSDLDPLAQVDALASKAVDVVAPVDAPDVRKALSAVSGAKIVDGVDRVLQLQLSERSGGPFDASAHPDGAVAARAAFLSALDPAALAKAAGAQADDTVLPQVGVASSSGAGSLPASSPSPVSTAGARPSSSAPASASTPTPGASPVGSTTVRLLVDTGDPVRAALATAITAQAARAGYTVRVVDASDRASALWSQPKAWDAALVPVAQGELPVAWVVDRWRTGGATNVTGHADPALDTLLDEVGAQPDADRAAAGLGRVAAALVASHVVLPLVRQPVLVATVAGGQGPGLDAVTPVTWGSADLSAWWGWALH